MPACIRGLETFLDCSDSAIPHIVGRRNTTINVTWNARIRMSAEFEKECVRRNIQINIVDNP